VFVNADGKLGAQVSSRRFKDAIKPLGQASEALFALKPVSFRYKKEIDSTAASQFGLVAEDVEKVDRDLVVRDKEGKAYSMRYDQVNAMLLNEFLKEHRKVGEQQGTIGQLKSNAAKQEATISELKKDMGVLTAQLKEQAAQIQKVSAELEASKPAPQMVNNP
jgi:trimeric autotransporter adhesin